MSDTGKGTMRMRTGGGAGEMFLQAQACWDRQKLGEAKMPLSEARGGSLGLQMICLVTLTLRTGTEYPLCVCCF